MAEGNTKITDRFWTRYRELVRSEMIPYQWKVLNDEIDVRIERERDDAHIPNKKSHALENFRIAAGKHSGHHYGWVFQDSDVYKWLEAAAYSLSEKMDENLKKLADSVVDLIGDAQEEDGYLSTYFTIEEPDRKFRRLRESHELYCAGHLMEAAVAYNRATGNRKVVEIAEKLADCIWRELGPEGRYGFDGHEEVEIGLMKLYQLTGKERYRELSRHFLMIRGEDPDFFEKERQNDPDRKPVIHGMDPLPLRYYQIHKKVVDQDTAEGHAVRLVYLCTAMADVAAACGDEIMLAACRKIWRNIVDRRMYITGGIGSTVHGEAFTFDYDLPNDTMYCETCASVGLVFFAKAMMENEADGEYGDVMERALYNTVLSGTALDGKHFFYVNPLEVNPVSSALDPGKSHVKAVRPEWLGCACCPPNLARLLASVDQYVYTAREDCCFVNLYMSSESCFSMKSGEIRIRQETGYPVSGKIRLQLEKEAGQKLRLGLRIPSWARTFALTVNGEACRATPEKGFVLLDLQEEKNEILLDLPMKPELWRARADLRSDIGKAAVGRGPLVYCLEEADNGKDLQMLSIKRDPDFAEQEEDGELGHIVAITAAGIRRKTAPVRGGLYGFDDEMREEKEEQRLRFIPYYTWANRGSHEMSVWVRTE